jgi:hypothetical protein
VFVSKDIVGDYLTELKFDLKRYVTSWPEFVQDDIIQRILIWSVGVEVIKEFVWKEV